MMKTVRTSKVGDLTLRVVQKDGVFVGAIIPPGKHSGAQFQGTDLDALWLKLNDEVGKAHPSYFGFDGARNRFLHFFPNGFRSGGYEGAERDYKVAAKQKLEAAAPLSTALNAKGLGAAVLAAYGATNLVSRHEKTKLGNLLRSADADAFVRAVAAFASGDRKLALADLEKLLRPFGCANWTVVTYLPFLWRPESHMFLKPEVTKDFASRVGHAFLHGYSARLTPDVYESLLDMVATTEQELAPLKPRDRIDVQSFIWVVGSYVEGRHKPKP